MACPHQDSCQQDEITVRRNKGPAFFAYANNYLIDVKFGVIVDVEASRAIRQAEVGAARTMIDRTEERFGLQAGAACGRYRLWGGSDAEPAGRDEGHRATYPGVRQVEAR